jgi:hypothetical protein
LLTATNKIAGGEVGQSADGAYKLFVKSNGASPSPSDIAQQIQECKKDDTFLHSGKHDSNVSHLYLFNGVPPRTFLMPLEQDNLIHDFRNPLLVFNVCTSCYAGEADYEESPRSFVKGMRYFVANFVPNPAMLAFLSTIPDSAIALSAAAVCLIRNQLFRNRTNRLIVVLWAGLLGNWLFRESGFSHGEIPSILRSSLTGNHRASTN